MDRVIDHWRLITDNCVAASFGLAADEYMTRMVGEGKSAPILRLYSYALCALVGRHQNVDHEINRDFCAANNIPINRRPTGGGAIIMGADQLGIALSAPIELSGAANRIRDLFARFARGIVTGLQALGIESEFGGKNDIEVQTKKLAGLGIYHDKSGGVLFHSSLLVDLDLATMLRILKTPFEKISDKAIATVAQRVTTVCREANAALDFEAVRAAIRDGYARQFGATFAPSYFTDEECAGIRAWEREKYQTREWVESKSVAVDGAGSARVKTPGGLVNVQLALANDAIKSIYITGDFFAEDESVNALERALKWRAADAGAIDASVSEFFAAQPDAFHNIASNDFARAITRAVEDARKKMAAGETYGCFVNP